MYLKQLAGAAIVAVAILSFAGPSFADPTRGPAVGGSYGGAGSKDTPGRCCMPTRSSGKAWADSGPVGGANGKKSSPKGANAVGGDS